MRTCVLIVSACAAIVANVAVADETLDEARAAIASFTEAVIAGPSAVAPLLAPEFQIMRANGVGYDREGYVTQGVGSVTAQPDFAHEDIVATRADDIMVVRYFLRIDETIDGAPVAQRAPRLTVFRKIDGQWRVVAHTNFGATEPAR